MVALLKSNELFNFILNFTNLSKFFGSCISFKTQHFFINKTYNLSISCTSKPTLGPFQSPDTTDKCNFLLFWTKIRGINHCTILCNFEYFFAKPCTVQSMEVRFNGWQALYNDRYVCLKFLQFQCVTISSVLQYSNVYLSCQQRGLFEANHCLCTFLSAESIPKSSYSRLS